MLGLNKKNRISIMCDTVFVCTFLSSWFQTFLKCIHCSMIVNIIHLTCFLFFSLSDVQTYEMAYGSCWEPVVAMFNLALDLISKPSVDPSRSLPWWDKARLLFHGRLTMTVERMSWLYHASFDPYNTTEFMDWTWSDLVLDWTNSE